MGRMKIHRIDHVGIVVNDLPAAKAFFLDFGLEMVGEATVEGEWVERIIGLQDVKAEIAMLRTPDGETNIELSQFYTPLDEKGLQRPLANTLGIRHIAFVVEDIDAIVAKLKKNGAELVGEIQTAVDQTADRATLGKNGAEPVGAIQTNENAYRLCYVRGPEGIILELAEQIK
jgi:catechol 2,3-dioxygenase-like lactoylglutathione lyase family enzyme